MALFDNMLKYWEGLQAIFSTVIAANKIKIAPIMPAFCLLLLHYSNYFAGEIDVSLYMCSSYDKG